MLLLCNAKHRRGIFWLFVEGIFCISCRKISHAIHPRLHRLQLILHHASHCMSLPCKDLHRAPSRLVCPHGRELTLDPCQEIAALCLVDRALPVLHLWLYVTLHHLSSKISSATQSRWSRKHATWVLKPYEQNTCADIIWPLLNMFFEDLSSGRNCD